MTDPIDYEALDNTLAEHYSAAIARRILKLNQRERLRLLRQLSDMERMSADPIPDNPLELRE